MATKEFSVKIQLRNGTEQEFQSANPTLLKGEICVVTDSNGKTRIKVGDGTSQWNSLSYYDEDFLRSTSDIKDTVVSFTTAGSRADISSGETTSTLFGKIKKWLSDLGSMAFKSAVSKTDLDSNLSNTIDNKATCDLYTVSLAADSWSGSAAPWSQSASCAGVTATNNLLVGCLSDKEEYDNCEVTAVSQTSGSLSFQAAYAKPTKDLSVFIVVLK